MTAKCVTYSVHLDSLISLLQNTWLLVAWLIVSSSWQLGIFAVTYSVHLGSLASLLQGTRTLQNTVSGKRLTRPAIKMTSSWCWPQGTVECVSGGACGRITEVSGVRRMSSLTWTGSALEDARVRWPYRMPRCIPSNSARKRSCPTWRPALPASAVSHRQLHCYFMIRIMWGSSSLIAIRLNIKNHYLDHHQSAPGCGGIDPPWFPK